VGGAEMRRMASILASETYISSANIQKIQKN
jgi:hypothetical protein